MSKIIFISGRFRSGTSLLWNIFNQLPQYCAYYEPLHPNLLSHIKHVKPKSDHLGIDDYWGSYTELTELKKFYSTEFGQHRLYLEKHDQWKSLKEYINYLISSAGEKTPVLQFNRTDLRLSWLKNNFPQATIIHIKRQAYPLWKSSRKHLNTDDHREDESHPDAYDLLQWSADLAVDFPMLQAQPDRSSYFRHYFIWKLSNQLANEHADLHLSLEKDFFESNLGIKALANKFRWDKTQIDLIKNIIQKPESETESLLKSDDTNSIEKAIDNTFKQLGLTKLFPSSPLAEIKLECHNHWKKYPVNPHAVTQELLNALRYQKDELTALVN
ncbi:MAG: sulfotransferase [Marinicellaceae bacterium]